MRSSSLAIRVVLLGALVGALAACGSSKPASSPKSSSKGSSSSTTSSGYLSVPAGTVLNVGDQEEDYETLFRVSGVGAKLPFKVNFVEFASGPLVDAGFASHRIDVGLLGDLPTALSVSSNLPLRAVALEDPGGDSPDEFLIAKPGITSLSQLRGKPVAYTTGTAEQALALGALAEVGLTQADVHQVDVSLQELYTVLEAGSVDASVIYGASLADGYLKSHPGAKVLGTNLDVKPTSYGYLLATTAALDNKVTSDAIYDFVRASLLAADWAYTHKQEYATDYLVDVLDETQAEADLGINAEVGFRDVPYSSAVSSAEQDLVKLEVQAGAIKTSFSVDPLYTDTSWWPRYDKLLTEVHQDAS